MTQYWDIFQAAYEAAPQETRDLVDSEKIGECVSSALTKSPDAVDRQKIIAVTSVLILNGMTTDEALEAFTAAGSTNNTRLLADIKDCLSMGATPAEEPKPISHIPVNEESELHTVRTMAEDMQHAKEVEAVHTSSQDALLQKEPSQESAAPRWGSETE